MAFPTLNPLRVLPLLGAVATACQPWIPAMVVLMSATPTIAQAPAGDPEEYLRQGESFGESQRLNAPRPGFSPDSYQITVPNRDGTSTQMDFGTRPDGTTYSPSDIDGLRNSYGDNAETRQQVDNRPPDPAADTVDPVKSDRSRTSMENDPTIARSDQYLQGMERDGGFTAQTQQCQVVEPQDDGSPHVEDPRDCVSVDAPAIAECTIDNELQLSTTDNQAVALTILIEKSDSMRGGNRMEDAASATVSVARALESAVFTEYSVHAYARGGDDPASADGMASSYSLTAFPENINDPGVITRYAEIEADANSTPTASVMDAAANVLVSSRREPRKLVLVLTDGRPSFEQTCPNAADCNPRGVAEHYAGEVQVAAVGIQSDAVQDDFDLYRVANSSGQIAEAVFEILSEDLGWFQVSNVWKPDTCIETAQEVQNETFAGEISCSAPPDSSGCVEIDGVRVCEGSTFAEQMSEPPVDNVPKVCGAIEVTDVEYCWRDSDGSQQCTNDTDEEAPGPTRCEIYRSDPQCGIKTSQCVESTRNEDGQCYVFEEVWDCGFREAGPNVTRDTEGNIYECDGQSMGCIDGSCMDDPQEENPNFESMATTLQMVEFTAQDEGTCDINNGCELFPGEAYYCKSEVFYGAENCCDDTPEVNFVAYITAAKLAWKGLKSEQMANWMASYGVDYMGYWQSFQSGAYDVYGSISSHFTSAFGSMSESYAGQAAVNQGAASTAEAGSQLGIDSIKQEILNQVQRWMERFAPAMHDALFAEGAQQGGQAVLSDQAQQYIGYASWIMTAYSYYQLAKFAITIIADCQDDEQPLFNIKRDNLRSCHVLGEYCHRDDFFGNCIERRLTGCCFNSPLSRILQQQLHQQPHLGLSWGDVRNPSCAAIPLETMAQVRWEDVDLSEWTDILYETGIAPRAADMQAAGARDQKTANVDDPNYYQPPDSDERYDRRSTDPESGDQSFDFSEIRDKNVEEMRRRTDSADEANNGENNQPNGGAAQNPDAGAASRAYAVPPSGRAALQIEQDANGDGRIDIRDGVCSLFNNCQTQ